MARRMTAPDIQASLRPNRPKMVGSSVVGDPSRTDRLVAILDHCTLAREAADEIGEKFLAYLLSMAIQESRSAMRQAPIARD